jgi:hypothetical protein
MVAYPGALPLPVVQPYAIVAQTGLSAVKFEHGNNRQRRGSRRARQVFSLSFTLTVAQLGQWVSWANGSGYDWELMSLAGPYSSGVVTPHLVRLIGSPEVQMLTPSVAQVSVMAELNVESVHAGIVIFTGNRIIAGAPSSPSASLVIGGRLTRAPAPALLLVPDGTWIVAQTVAIPAVDFVRAGVPALRSVNTITAGQPEINWIVAGYPKRLAA